MAVLFLSSDVSKSERWESEINELAESSDSGHPIKILHVTDSSSLQSLFTTAVDGGVEYLLFVSNEPPACPGLIDRMVGSLRRREGRGVVSTPLGSARMIHKSHAQVFDTIVPSSLSSEASWQWLRLVYGGSSSIIECKTEADRQVTLEESDLVTFAKELSNGCINLSLHLKAQGSGDWDKLSCGELKGSPTDPVSHQLMGEAYTLAGLPKPQGGWLVLKEELAEKADKDKVVFVAFTNDGFLPMTLNWVYYVEKLGLEYILIALDEKVYKELQDYNIPTFYDSTMSGSSGEEVYATTAYVTITVLKIRYALLITSLGYNTFLCDTDIVVLKVGNVQLNRNSFSNLGAFRILFWS